LIFQLLITFEPANPRSRVSGLITIVESVFNYPGIGYLLLNSIRTRDFIVVQGVVLFMAFLVIVVNLMVDIFYTVLDPRIRYR
jgi:peptide/nickel transport system permease protein